MGFISRMEPTASSILRFSASSCWILAIGLKARDIHQQFLVGRQEFVQGRVDQANDDGIAFARLGIDHRLEDAFEVAALEGQQLVEGGLPLFFGFGEDHLLHDGQAFLLHEHMLGAAEADAFRAKGDGAFGVAGIVGVGPDAEAAVLVGPGQQFAAGRSLSRNRLQRF